MTKMHPKEADVKTAVKKVLTEAGWWHWMSVASHGFGVNGASDIFALKHGTFVAIETKLKKSEGSPLQERFGNNVSANGGYYRVVNMQHIESGEFKEWITELDNRTRP